MNLLSTLLALGLALEVALGVVLPPAVPLNTNFGGQTRFDYDLTMEWRLSSTVIDGRKKPTYIVWNPTQYQHFFYPTAASTPCQQNAVYNGPMDTFVQMDGLHRRITTINGHSPGPTMVVPYQAHVVVRTTNRLFTESFSVHFHGLDNIWYMDGVSHVEQCPISHGGTFIYDFHADKPGTHWYHGHLSHDRGDGMVGAIVIMDPPDRQQIPLPEGDIIPDIEYVVVLQDWGELNNHENAANTFDSLQKFMHGFDQAALEKNQCHAYRRYPDGAFVGGSVPLSSILFNDKGWYNQGELLTAANRLQLERFQVSNDQYMRFRIVHGGFGYGLQVSIDDHDFYVIAADGDRIIPQRADQIIIQPAERYDLIIKTKANPERRNYYIKAQTIAELDGNNQVVSRTYGAAVLEYVEQSSATFVPPDFAESQCTEESPCTAVGCPFRQFPAGVNINCVNYGDLRNQFADTIQTGILQKGYTPGDPNQPYQEFFFNMHRGENAHISRFSMLHPAAPPYFHMDNLDLVAKSCRNCPPGSDPDDPNCQCFHFMELAAGYVTQFVVYNMGVEDGAFKLGSHHPFHMHGHHFYIMKVGYGTYDPASNHVVSNNDDFPCNGLEGYCDEQSWTDPSQLNGNVEGMNLVDPIMKDTVIVPSGGYVVLRFITSNYGWYYAHCHLMLHHLKGMAVALKIGTSEEIRNEAPPPFGFPADCGNLLFETGGTKRVNHPEYGPQGIVN